MKKALFWIVPTLLIGLSYPGHLCAENAYDYIAKGNQLANTKKFTEALEQYQKALKIDPKNPRATLLIGLCYAQTGDLDTALTFVERASTNNPSYTSFYNLGLIRSVRGEFNEAVKAFDRAIELEPKSFEASYQKGLAYGQLKKYDQAILSYQKALELNPSFDNARIALFAAYLIQENLQAAQAQIDEFRQMKKTGIVQALEARMKKKAPIS
ncbi:MAG: tetratricopeptide repeat protein [Candidatus Omnitrophota bacterium]